MKYFSLSLLLITAVFLGTAQAQAAIVVVNGPAPYYGAYYGAYYHPWVRHYYRAVAPRPVYYAAPNPYYYAPAPAPVVVAPVLPLALRIGFHIR